MIRLGLVALALITACGAKDDDKKSKEPAKNEPAKDDRPKNTDPPLKDVTDTNAPPAKAPPLPDKAFGTCTFEITGDVTAKEETAGGGSAALASYWTEAALRKKTYGDKEGLVVNCATPRRTLSFTATNVGADQLPYGPKKYTLTVGKSEPFSVLGRLDNWVLLDGGDGTLDVTAFDATHIAGTFDLTLKLDNKRKHGTAKVKGQFDYKCPGTCK